MNSRRVTGPSVSTCDNVTGQLPPLGAPPIAIAAFSGLARLAACREGLRATVRWLLAQGADANTNLRLPGAEHPLPVLYGATAHGGDGKIVQALLAAGADPNDNESLYHATEQADRSILDALVQAGARWPGTNALFRQLDHNDLPGLHQALGGAQVHLVDHGGHHLSRSGVEVDLGSLVDEVEHGFVRRLKVGLAPEEAAYIGAEVCRAGRKADIEAHAIHGIRGYTAVHPEFPHARGSRVDSTGAAHYPTTPRRHDATAPRRHGATTPRRHGATTPRRG